MAKRAVEQKWMAIRTACEVFSISEHYYRYKPKNSEEDAIIVDWLIRLTRNYQNWGFGLCFLYLRA